MAQHRVLPFRATLSVKLAVVLFGAVAGALMDELVIESSPDGSRLRFVKYLT